MFHILYTLQALVSFSAKKLECAFSLKKLINNSRVASEVGRLNVCDRNIVWYIWGHYGQRQMKSPALAHHNNQLRTQWIYVYTHYILSYTVNIITADTLTTQGDKASTAPTCTISHTQSHTHTCTHLVSPLNNYFFNFKFIFWYYRL